MNSKNLINWSELSRFLTRGDRGAIRTNKIPKKYKDKVDVLLKAVVGWENSIKISDNERITENNK